MAYRIRLKILLYRTTQKNRVFVRELTEKECHVKITYAWWWMCQHLAIIFYSKLPSSVRLGSATQKKSRKLEVTAELLQKTFTRWSILAYIGEKVFLSVSYCPIVRDFTPPLHSQPSFAFPGCESLKCDITSIIWEISWANHSGSIPFSKGASEKSDKQITKWSKGGTVSPEQSSSSSIWTMAVVILAKLQTSLLGARVPSTVLDHTIVFPKTLLNKLHSRNKKTTIQN